MIVVTIPDTFVSEKKYSIDVLLNQILGLDYVINVDEHISNYIFTLPNQKEIHIAESFFRAADTFLNDSYLPETISYLHHDLLQDSNLVILYGTNQIVEFDHRVEIKADIIASIFFMLSRWEETIIHVRDNHDRFPASASTAFKNSFLDRPIVDEYATFIMKIINKLCPKVRSNKLKGEVVPTCDVDYPFDPSLASKITFFKGLIGDVVKRRDLKLFFSRIKRYKYFKKGDFSLDPFYTFDWFMDMCERYNRRAEFYFISGHSGGAIDGCYSLNDKIVTEVATEIHNRGHIIGMHGSYNTFRDFNQIKVEKNELVKMNQALGLNQSVEMNRQHFLRWDTSETPDHLERADFKYDSTGGYADVSGFRYGTAHKFQMWSWIRNQPLNLIQKPLICMENSVIGSKYQGLGYTEEALDYMLTLKKKSLEHNGNFTFLWHNSYFNNARDKEFFEYLIS